MTAHPRQNLRDPQTQADQAAAEKQAGDSLGSFLDFDEPVLATVDRSTLEAYSVCPAQARFVETGAVGKSVLASSGAEVHKVFSGALTEYIDNGGQMNVGELAATVEAWARHSRPDVQPDVIAGVRASVYSWSKFIAGGSIHPGNILRYDGGMGKRAGQLALDWPEYGIRLTSEIDLLHAGPSPEVLHEVDYKSGHKIYTAADVASSFQFQLHALLVLANYPKVQALSVRVWNTRVNRVTWTVEFRRDTHLLAIEARVRSAALHWKTNRLSKPEAAPTWPTLEKCRICDAAAFCPAATADVKLLADNPGIIVDALVAAEARVDALKALLSPIVDKTKADVVSEAGNAFGYDKPKRPSRAKKDTYSVKPDDSESESETE